MPRYYTRVCNFYYGSKSRSLVKEKKALPLNGNNKISFDKVEIISRKSKKKVSIRRIDNLPDRIRMSMERVITPIIVRNAAMELEEFMGSLESIAMRSSSNSSPQLLEDVIWAFEVIKLLRLKMANYFKILHKR